MKALIIAIIALFVSTFASAQSFTATDNNEIRTAKFYFTCNSATTYSVGSQELADMANGTIISIDAYASVEGNVDANQALSLRRLETICTLLETGELFGTAHGATAQFGNAHKDNRIVIVTYSMPKATNSANNTDVTAANKTTNVEGFNCGNVVDPAIYFADTLNESIAIDTMITIQAPIVLENVKPSLQHDSTSYVVKPVPADTSFLPVRQAVRYQMREYGMSREAAIKSIEARKSQWKELKPKAKTRKGNARKVKMRKTRGANRSMFVRIFPFAGC